MCIVAGQHFVRLSSTLTSAWETWCAGRERRWWLLYQCKVRVPPCGHQMVLSRLRSRGICWRGRLQCQSVSDDSPVIKPTKEGVQDWADVSKLIDVVNCEFPDLAVSLPCYYGKDHDFQKDALCWSECHPFNVGAIAKITVRYALYVSALKIFVSPWLCPPQLQLNVALFCIFYF